MEDLLNKILEDSKTCKNDLVKIDKGKRTYLLKKIAKALGDSKFFILMENEKDIALAKEKGLKESLIERLTLNDKRIEDLIESVLSISNFPDEVFPMKMLKK